MLRRHIPIWSKTFCIAKSVVAHAQRVEAEGAEEAPETSLSAGGGRGEVPNAIERVSRLSDPTQPSPSSSTWLLWDVWAVAPPIILLPSVALEGRLEVGGAGAGRGVFLIS